MLVSSSVSHTRVVCVYLCWARVFFAILFCSGMIKLHSFTHNIMHAGCFAGLFAKPSISLVQKIRLICAVVAPQVQGLLILNNCLFTTIFDNNTRLLEVLPL